MGLYIEYTDLKCSVKRLFITVLIVNIRSNLWENDQILYGIRGDLQSASGGKIQMSLLISDIGYKIEY